MTATTTIYVPIVSSLSNPPPTVPLPGPSMAPQSGAASQPPPTPPTASQPPASTNPYSQLTINPSAAPIPAAKYSKRYYGVLYCTRAAPDGDVLPPDFTQYEVQLLQHVAKHVALVLDASDGLDLTTKCS